jgi:hypothetical protein
MSSKRKSAPTPASQSRPSKRNATQNSTPSGSTSGNRTRNGTAYVISEEEEDATYKDTEVIEVDVHGQEKPSAGSDNESSEAELSMSNVMFCLIAHPFADRLKKKWNSPIYGFFKPTPEIKYVDNRRSHVFLCAAKGCSAGVRRFVDRDASTSNLRKHAKKCWGEDTVKAADTAKSAQEVRDKIVSSILRNGSITATFERKGSANVTYSHRQHTKTETK